MKNTWDRRTVEDSVYILIRNGWKRGFIWREGKTWFGVAPFGGGGSIMEVSGKSLRDTKLLLIGRCNREWPEKRKRAKAKE